MRSAAARHGGLRAGAGAGERSAQRGREVDTVGAVMHVTWAAVTWATNYLLPPSLHPSLPPSRRSLQWSSEDGIEHLRLAYPDIAVHAVSRDSSSFPHHCVFLLHCPSAGEEWEEGGSEGVGAEEEGETEDASGAMTEIRLVPPEATQC